MAKPTWERVQMLIVEQLGVSAIEVTPHSHFVDDFGTDWIDLEELRMAFEEEYDVRISKEDFSRLPTVQDLLDYLIKRVK
jgi:acyl carrier protein